MKKVNLDQFCNGRIYRIDEIAYKLGISGMEASLILCKIEDYEVETLYYEDAGYFYSIKKI